MKRCVIAVCLALAACVTTHDQAYERAHVYGAEDGPILLILHGCSGTFEWFWQQFMVEQGFLIVFIDSFQDQRPAQSCHPPFPSKAAIYDTRKRQAVYALTQISKDYPGRKVIVWGHSEGAGVAQLIDLPVAGIVTTGYQCGYRLTGTTRIRPDVPWLAVLARDDPYLRHPVQQMGSLRAICKQAQRSPVWSHVILPAGGHRPALASFREPLVAFITRALDSSDN